MYDELPHIEQHNQDVGRVPDTIEPGTDQPLGEMVEPSPGASIKDRRRVLVIAYYFPPLGGSGVLRIAKFCKYLTEFGWDPTVLTVGDIGYFAYDQALHQEVVNAGVRIEPTRTLDPLRLLKRRKRVKMPSDRLRRFLSGLTHIFLQPDNKIGWKRYALKRGLELLEQDNYDAILSTAPPFTDFLIGAELQRRSGLPLVIDYRDPWVDNRNYFYLSPFHKRYAAGLEEEVLKNADGIVVVNRRIKERLIARHPFLGHDNVVILPSGFDSRDFRDAQRYPLERPRKMRVTYIGLFDARRTPKTFFQALGKVFARHPEMRDEIEACFVGMFPESFRKMAQKYGVSSALVTPGYLEHRDSVRYLLSSDVLWLTIFDPNITPGKVYEYIGSRKPILALAPEGGVRQVLADYGAAVCVEPNDVDAIAEALLEYYRQWSSGTLPSGDPSRADEYDQYLLTERLARVLAYSLKI